MVGEFFPPNLYSKDFSCLNCLWKVASINLYLGKTYAFLKKKKSPYSLKSFIIYPTLARGLSVENRREKQVEFQGKWVQEQDFVWKGSTLLNRKDKANSVHMWVLQTVVMSKCWNWGVEATESAVYNVAVEGVRGLNFSMCLCHVVFPTEAMLKCSWNQSGDMICKQSAFNIFFSTQWNFFWRCKGTIPGRESYIQISD